MISFMSKYVALFFYKNEIIDEKRLPVCEYGFELIISTIIGFLLVSVSGIILGTFSSALLFYALFIVVRSFTGGYHADTHFRCKLTLLVCCLFVLIISKYFELSFAVQAVLLASYLIAVFLFSPIEHINVPLTEGLKRRNRIISIIIAIALTIINLLGYRYFSEISKVSSLTLFVIAILIIIPKIKERRKD